MSGVILFGFVGRWTTLRSCLADVEETSNETMGWPRALGLVAAVLAPFDETVTIEDRMDRADGRTVEVRVLPRQALPDLGAPQSGFS